MEPQIDLDLNLERSSLNITLHKENVADFCVLLSLLEHLMLDSFLIAANRKPVIRCHYDPKLTKKIANHMGKVRKDGDLLVLIFSKHTMELWLTFALGYYRDTATSKWESWFHTDMQFRDVDKSLGLIVFGVTMMGA